MFLTTLCWLTGWDWGSDRASMSFCPSCEMSLTTGPSTPRTVRGLNVTVTVECLVQGRAHRKASVLLAAQ